MNLAMTSLRSSTRSSTFVSLSTFVLLSFLAGLLTSCSTDESATTVTIEDIDKTISVLPDVVTTIYDGSDRPILTLPAGLSITQISIQFSISNASGQPEQDRLQSFVYRFEGEHDDFLKVADLRLPIPNIELTAGQSIKIARLHNGHWFELPGTQISGEFAEAEIHQLGDYALVLTDKTPAPQRVIGNSCDNATDEQIIDIVHVADLHSRYGKSQSNAYARIKAYERNVRNNNTFTLFTNAGDDFEKGHVAEGLTSGQSTVDMTQAMQFDIRTIGNHDVAWGHELMYQFSEDLHGEVLATNFIYRADNYPTFPAIPYAEYQVGCAKIGVFSMVGRAWDEFDSEYFGDYTNEVSADFGYNKVARNIIEQHRDNVDIMILLSHLGWGTDQSLAEFSPGIDLILGGHSHGGVRIDENVNGAYILQPNFFAFGLSHLSLSFSNQTKKITAINHQDVDLDSLTELDTDILNRAIEMESQLANRLANKGVESENTLHEIQIKNLVAEAAIQVLEGDAVMLDPELKTSDTLFAGTVDVQNLYTLYYPERQKPNTPSFNALYTMQVNGEQLSSMQQAQPDWISIGPDTIDPQQSYSIILQKAAALNPQTYFGESFTASASTFANEVWQVLESYASYKQVQCEYIDSPTTTRQCLNNTAETDWQFDLTDSPLQATSGPGQLSYFDPDNTNWWPSKIQFATASQHNIPAYPNQAPDKYIMSVAGLDSNQGLVLRHQAAANGDFSDQNLVSDWTLVIDILSPTSSDGQWRALFQTSANNADDADLFIENKFSGGVGIQTYFGEIKPHQWHRIAFVAYASEQSGIARVYIDGVEVGLLENVNQRWALSDQSLLFTDNNAETQALYIGKLMFSGRAYTSDEIAALGKVGE
jgi:5'-nucleotidase / UDP-sugar diphosphatase